MMADQEYTIPLNSPLDVNMNDQLVKVTQPLFTYNRQKLLGGVMQTSIRYEDDGYFAGWWRHQFVLVSDGINYIHPSFNPNNPSDLVFEMENMVIYNRFTDVGFPYWVVKHRAVGLKFAFTDANYIDIFTGSVVIGTRNNNLLSVDGTTSMGTTYTATFDVYSGKLITSNVLSPFRVSTRLYNNMIQLRVDKPLVKADDWFDLRLPPAVSYKGSALNTTSDATYWNVGSAFRVNRSNGAATSGIISAGGSASNGITNATLYDYTAGTFIVTPEYEDVWDNIELINAEPLNEIVGGSKIGDDSNKMRVHTPKLSDDTATLKTFRAEVDIPVWLRARAVFNLNWTGGSGTSGDQVTFVGSISNVRVENQTMPSGEAVLQIRGRVWQAKNVRQTDGGTITYTSGWSSWGNSTGVNISGGTGVMDDSRSSRMDIGAEIQVGYNSIPFFFARWLWPQQTLTGWDAGNVALSIPVTAVYSEFKSGFLANSNISPLNIIDIANDDALFDEGGSRSNRNTGSWNIGITIPVCVLNRVFVTLSSSKSLMINGNAAQFMSPYPTIGSYTALGVHYYGLFISERNIMGLAAGTPILEQGANDDEYNVIVPLINTNPLTVITTQYATSGPEGERVILPVRPPWIQNTSNSGTNSYTAQYTSTQLNKFLAVVYKFKISKIPRAIKASGRLEYTRNIFNASLFNQIYFQLANQQGMGPEITVTQNNYESTIRIDFGNSAYAQFVLNKGSTAISTSSNSGSSYNALTVGAASGVVTNGVINAVNVPLTDNRGESVPYAYPAIRGATGLATGIAINQITDSQITFTGAKFGPVNRATTAMADTTDYVVIGSEPRPDVNTIRYYIGRNDTADIRILPQGIFQINKPSLVYQSYTKTGTHHQVEFSYMGQLRIANIDLDTKLNLKYETKDIRNQSSAKFIYQNDLENMYQFIKQFWSDTVLTENYWWIDSSHVLELTREEVILWVKVTENLDGQEVGTVDDWGGDKWRVETEESFEQWNELVNGQLVTREGYITKERRVPRSNFFGISDIYYNVSNAKDSVPYLFKIQTIATGIRILYINSLTCTYSTMRSDFSLKPSNDRPINNQWSVLDLDVHKQSYGAPLSNGAIEAYVDLNTAAMISAAKISSTVIGDYFLIGIAYSRGLLQWTINVSTGWIINGYGHVGIDGTLTGGQLPQIFCDGGGFNAAVQSLDYLESVTGWSETNAVDKLPSTPPNICVGTGSTIWFISKQINAIVSHYVFNVADGSYNMRTVSLPSNVERHYASTSFQGRALFDLFNEPINFSDVIGTLLQRSKAWVNVISYVMMPVLFYIDLKYVMVSYINHSFGQYAYVWRAGNRDYLPEGKTDQDVKFLQDKQTITMSQNVDGDGSALLTMVLKLVGLTDNILTDYMANQSQNQVTMDDSVGRKLGQFFVDNVASTVSDLIQTTGFDISLKSTIAQSYTLDMFYSISDSTECYAGPGFVNHNLIGQCVAQSLTDTQMRGQRVGYWCTLKALSVAVLELKVLIFRAIQDGLRNIANGIGSAEAGGFALGSGVMVPVGSIIATIMNIAASAIDALIVMNQVGMNILGQLADALGPATGTPYQAGALHKYNLDIEGTHTYGNKPMNFFYPAYGVISPVEYTKESVATEATTNEQNIRFTGKVHEIRTTFSSTQLWSSGMSNLAFINGSNSLRFQGNVKNVHIKCKGVSKQQKAPDRMAVIEGVSTFLSPTAFRNEQIGVSPAVFPPPPVHDYEIDPKWKIGFTAVAGEITWVCCDDTKVIDGAPSNIVILNDFCGIASSYTAIEVFNTFDERYLRPWAVTPTAIALNINRMNCVHNQKVYHAFDGQGNRIIKWAGGSGMDKAVLYHQYQFQVNDHFKRSNILPPSQFFGIFEGPPSIAAFSTLPSEPVANLVQANTRQFGMENNIPGENKNLQRYAIPVFSTQLSTLPAVVRMLAPYKLNVVEGITSLTTDLRNTQTRYKAPSSIDFNVYNNMYRATEEYLCELQMVNGVIVVRDICATAGLKYIGATTKEAYFWSPATRLYYAFSDGREIQKVDVMNRFTDLLEGRWDYVNQEVMFKAQINNDVIVTRLDGVVLGEVFPPNQTIYSRDRLIDVDDNSRVLGDWERDTALNSGDIVKHDNKLWTAIQPLTIYENIVAPPNGLFKVVSDEDAIATATFYNTDYIDVYNRRVRRGSDYKLLSMAGGTVFQGPKRFIVNRFVILDYMVADIKKYSRRFSVLGPVNPEWGKKNWCRVSRDYYDQTRNYGWEYVNFDKVRLTQQLEDSAPIGSYEEQDLIWWSIHGWTHNPKGLVTSMLGVDDGTDCKFEWSITFAWTTQMDMIYDINEYATVNVRAETVTQGGTILSPVTHIYLYKECFTRSGNAGHYTFRFQSQNGIGNRERLYLWGDAITALQDLKLRCVDITVKRTQSLHTQIDVQDKDEI